MDLVVSRMRRLVLPLSWCLAHTEQGAAKRTKRFKIPRRFDQVRSVYH